MERNNRGGVTLERLLLEYCYPIGSIYQFTISTNPVDLFGGTWVGIYETFLLASGNNFLAGTTGGEAKHTLTIAEMPSHNRTFASGYHNSSSTTYNIKNVSLENYPENPVMDKIGYTGGGTAHNNMPPYYAVYMWRRTA